MHGRRKENVTVQEEKKRTAKVKWYRNLMETIFEKRKNKEYDDEALSLTSEVLRNIPDINTLWNYRKQVLKHMKATIPEEELRELVDRELKLTKDCLIGQPKSYGTWFQRCWVLDHISSTPDYDKELELCNYYLELDERNFHCWDYRRYVTDRHKVLPSKELTYSTEKIEANFSNYSAWHYRSKLLPLLYPDPNNHLPIEQDKYVEEFSMVESAVFTEPKDQSAWFYQRWLLGERYSEVKVISAGVLHNGVTFVVFNQLVDLNPTSLVKVDSNVLMSWSSLNGASRSFVWLSDVKHMKKEMKLVIEGKIAQIMPLDQQHVYVSDSYKFYQELNEELALEVKKQSDSIETLIQMEPENKFALLTSITLLQHLNPLGENSSPATILNRFEQLKTLDPLRLNYYNDIESKYKMETFIQSKSLLSPVANLSNLQLSSLHHVHCFAHCKEVILSENKLTNNCLRHLTPLVSCEILKLSQCSLTSLQLFPLLPSLQTLDASHNSIDQIEDCVFQKYEACVQVILTGNPVSEDMVVKHCTLVI
uniref:Geranylgeranyl transferase type-2 subunit alpha n=1 Tax=Cacopsylla melanoneura TaxID=428564 RepID=A0A8D8SC86_9HEMI